MTTSANAKFDMKKLVIVCMDLVVVMIQITREFPITATKLIVPYRMESNTMSPTGTSYRTVGEYLSFNEMY